MAQQNISLVPQEQIQLLNELDQRLNNSIKTLNSYLATSQRVSEELSKSTKNYKDLNNAEEEYQKTTAEIIREEQKQQNILEQINKIKLEVIKTDQEQLKIEKDLLVSRQQAQKAIDGISKSLAEAQEETRQIRKEQVELRKEYDKGNKTYDDFIKRNAELNARLSENQKDTRTLTAELKNNQAIVQNGSETYANLSAQYSILKTRINELDEGETVNGRTKQDLEKQAKALYEEMSRLQKQTGKNTLDVGKYEKANKSLNVVLQTISPTLARTTVAVRTFGKALLTLLANPIVATIAAIVAVIAGLVAIFNRAIDVAKGNEEQFNRLQQAMAPLRVVGDALTRVFEDLADVFIRVAGAVYSAYVRFSDFIGLTENLTETVQEYIQVEKERLQLSKDTRQVNELEAKNASRIADLRATLADREGTSIAERQKALNDLKDLELQTFEERSRIAKENLRLLEEETSRTKNSTADEEKLSQARIAVYRAEEQFQNARRQINREQTQLERERTRNANAAAAEQKRLASEAAQAERARLKEQKDLIRAESQLNLYRVENEAETNREIYSDNQKSYNERLAALRDYINKRKEAIRQSADIQLQQEGLSQPAMDLINEKALNEQLKLERDFVRESEQITKDYVAEQIRTYEELRKERSNSIREAEREELAALANSFGTGAIKRQEDYEKQRADITIKYSQERSQAEIDSLNEILTIADLTEKQRFNFAQQIRDLELKAVEEQTQAEIRLYEAEGRRRLQIQRQVEQQVRQLATETFNLFNTIANASYQNQINRIDSQKEALQSEYDERIKKIDEELAANLISQEVADAQKNYYARTQEEREEELEEQRKEILTRQAKYDKASSIIQATIATSLAVAKALPNLVLAALVGATGAAQIAAIAAQPLPQYAEGTDDHPGGLAVVGDGGRSEMVLTPQGKVFKTPSKPTLMDLPKGTEVFPDYNQALADMAMQSVNKSFEVVPIIIDSRNQDRLLMDSINVQRQARSIASESLKAFEKNNLKISQLTSAINSTKRRRYL